MISKGNHVKFAHFVWLAICEEAKQRPGLQVNVYCRNIFVSVQCIIKLRFCDIQNNQGLVKSYQLKPKASRFLRIAVSEDAKQRPGLQVNVNTVATFLSW